jgi:hypothetical protein
MVNRDSTDCLNLHWLQMTKAQQIEETIKKKAKHNAVVSGLDLARLVL